MDNVALLIWIALLLPAAIFLALPRLTPRGYFFGITVPPDFPQTESGREIRRGYALTVAVAFVLGLALGIIVPQAMPAAVFLPIFASTGAFFYARHHVKPFSTSARRPPAAEVGGSRESLPAWTLLGLPRLRFWLSSQPTCDHIGTRFRRAFPCIGVGMASRTVGRPARRKAFTGRSGLQQR